jgi:hypothetical protein
LQTIPGSIVRPQIGNDPSPWNSNASGSGSSSSWQPKDALPHDSNRTSDVSNIPAVRIVSDYRAFTKSCHLKLRLSSQCVSHRGIFLRPCQLRLIPFALASHYSAPNLENFRLSLNDCLRDINREFGQGWPIPRRKGPCLYTSGSTGELYERLAHSLCCIAYWSGARVDILSRSSISFQL